MGLFKLHFLSQGGLPNTLSRISIGKCENLVALPDHVFNLSSLQELEICQCRRIMSFPEEGFPTSLTTLTIEDFNLYKPLIGWGLHKLTSLRNLSIGGCLDAMSFPQEELDVMLPTSLTKLAIAKFPELSTCLPRVFGT